MQNTTINDLISLNRELMTLSKSGLSFSLAGLENTGNRLSNASQDDSALLDQINDYLSASHRSKSSIQKDIATEFPDAINYCRAIAIYESTGSRSLALEQLRFPKRVLAQITSQLTSAIVYPVILSVLVLLGFALICLYTTPTIAAMYEQVQQQPPASVQFLLISRELFPIWSIAAPLVLFLLLTWWITKGSKKPWRWIPGNEAYYEASCKAHAANLLSQLIANGCETKLATSLSASHWTATVSTDIPLEEFKQSIQEDQNERSKDSLPPLMKWAVTREEADGESLQKMLPIISDIYNNTASRDSQGWHAMPPTVVGVVIGGLIVFAYSFSLFNPVIEILEDLANPLTGLGK